MSEIIGTIKVRGEEAEIGITDCLSMKHESRIVHVVKCEDGTICIHTIRIDQEGNQIQTGYRFSRETFCMLTAAMAMAAQGWNIDVEGFMSMLANGSDEIECEFASNSDAWENIITKK